jgi:hypothetical protein
MVLNCGYPAVKGAMLHVLPGDFELPMPSSTKASVHVPSFATLPPQYTGSFGKQDNDIYSAPTSSTLKLCKKFYSLLFSIS